MTSPHSERAHAPTRLCLVRHGETAWNAQRRLQGHLDVELNAVGHAQARAAARRLAGERFTALYSSDLLRTHQTASTLATVLHLPVIPERGLRERHYGCIQGLTYEEAEARHPAEYARFKAREADFGFPGGGETLRAFSARIADTLHRITRQHAGESVLLVTHGGVLDAVHRLCSGAPMHTPRDFAIPNAGLNWIEQHGDRWRILNWADESHLEGALDELANA